MASKYEQIAAEITGRIVRGELAPGDLLPSERETAERWGVARMTVVQAYRKLAADGLVEPRQGTGTVVLDRPRVHLTAHQRYEHTQQAGNIYRPGESARILAADLVPAPADVAAQLGVEAGAPAIRRHRVTYEGSVPAATSISWHPGEMAEAAPRLLETERIREGLRYTELQTGRRVAVIKQWYRARLASPEECESLRLTAPAAVAESHSLALDADGQPVEYGVSVAGDGRVTYSQEHRIG